MLRPNAPSCERNAQPILEVLQKYITTKTSLFEVGSGTGQHSTYFIEYFPDLVWQTSDLMTNHIGIGQWIDESKNERILSPLEFELGASTCSIEKYDVVFSANTLHIMSWENCNLLFKKLGNELKSNSHFIVYGPFNYNGKFTSPSNEKFESWLKKRDTRSGIRDFEEVVKILKEFRINLIEDVTMPANNRMLVFIKE